MQSQPNMVYGILVLTDNYRSINITLFLPFHRNIIVVTSPKSMGSTFADRDRPLVLLFHGKHVV